MDMSCACMYICVLDVDVDVDGCVCVCFYEHVYMYMYLRMYVYIYIYMPRISVHRHVGCMMCIAKHSMKCNCSSPCSCVLHSIDSIGGKSHRSDSVCVCEG